MHDLIFWGTNSHCRCAVSQFLSLFHPVFALECASACEAFGRAAASEGGHEGGQPGCAAT